MEELKRENYEAWQALANGQHNIDIEDFSRVVAASLDNFAYFLSLNKGSLIWRRQLPGRISARPFTSSDGALFTPFSTDQAIVLNLRDGKTANTLPLGEENSSSAAPVSVNNLVLITVPHGLLAFSGANPPPQQPDR